MADYLHVISLACLVLLFSASTKARDDACDDVKKQIAYFDAKLDQLEVKHGAAIEAIKETAALRETEIAIKFEQLEGRHAAEMERLKQDSELREEDLLLKIEHLNKRVDSLQTNNAYMIQKNDDIRSGHVGTTHTAKQKRDLPSTYNIAFSAYMDHDADRLRNGQTLTFNHMLLNEAGAYNNRTGVFTVPTTGVYSFTFFIGQRDRHQSVVALYVNNDNMVDGIVQTDDDYQDGQGGNSAVLKVTAGDRVYVKSTNSDHIEGSPTWRYTTFSGFMLFPTDGNYVTVVGK